MREFLDYFSGGLNEVALGKGELFKDDAAFPADATSLFTRLDHTPIAATPASAVRHTPVALILSNGCWPFKQVVLLRVCTHDAPGWSI